MELLRESHPSLTLSQIVVFLHVADEDDGEPIPLTDLQYRADLSPVQAWRTAKALERDQGLVRLDRWKTRKALAISLSSAGEALRKRLDAILRRAEPIIPRPSPLAAAE